MNRHAVVKRFLSIFTVLTVLAGSGTFVYYHIDVKSKKTTYETSEIYNVKHMAEMIVSNLKSIASDLMVLSDQNELHVLLKNGGAGSIKTLNDELFVFCDRKKLYNKVRFIDETGLEIASIKFNNDDPQIVPHNQLQSVANSDYFLHTFQFGQGEVYVSPFNLKSEKEESEQPRKSIIYFGTPVFDSQGLKRGIIVLDYLGSKLLYMLRTMSVNTMGQLMLLNSDGFSFTDPNSNNQQGNSYRDNEPGMFSATFPKTWQQMSITKAGQFSNDEGLFTFTVVYPRLEVQKASSTPDIGINESDYKFAHDVHHWKIVSYISPELLYTSKRETMSKLFLFLAPLIVGLAIGSWFIARMSINRKQAVEASQKNEERYRLLFNSGNDAVFVYHLTAENRPGKFFEVNEIACKRLGYTKEELLQLSIVDINEPQKLKKIGSILKKLSANKHLLVEVQHVAKDGSKIPVEINTHLFDFNGQPTVIAIARDITDRKKAEAALNESEIRFRSVTQSANDAIISANSKGIIISWNKGAKEIFGYNENEVLNKQLTLLIPEQNRDAHQTGLERFFSTGEPKLIGDTIELVGLRKNGSEFPCELSLSTWKIHEDTFVTGIMRDITKRKRVEKILQESEEKYRMVVESSPGFIFPLDRDGRILDINQAMGQEELEILITSYVYDDIYPDDQEIFKENIEMCFNKAGVCDFEVKSTNGLFVFQVFLAPIRNPDRTVDYIVCNMYDITERIKAEKALHENEEKYRKIVESSHDLIWITDRMGIFTFINHRGTDITGYAIESVIGTNSADLIHPDDLNASRKHFRKVILKGETQTCELRIKDKKGKYITLLATFVPTFENDKISGVMAFGLDITDRKRGEEALRKTADELIRSNAELQQFAYVASHDLQEPLRMIGSYTQLLARRYKGKLDKDADEFIEFTIDGVNRMQTLINDLLTFSRVGTKGKSFQPTNCTAVLETKLQDLKFVVEESSAVVNYDSLPTVNADEVQLGQLFQNLISNAIKFRNEKPPVINIGAERIDDYWTFFVKDNGIGIDHQYKERVFTIFQRLHTRKEYSGTGIGLAVCKKIVDRHGGKIWLESELGSGTTFYFTIPGTEVNRHDQY